MADEDNDPHNKDADEQHRWMPGLPWVGTGDLPSTLRWKSGNATCQDLVARADEDGDALVLSVAFTGDF